VQENDSNINNINIISLIVQKEEWMERTPVQSSNIASVGHEGDTLEIEFRNGGVFRYPGVVEEVFKGMLAAPSIGKHFHSHIRPKFKGVKVGGKP
jgi:hypothetical protein